MRLLEKQPIQNASIRQIAENSQAYQILHTAYKGKALGVFIPDWIGRFYAYYQWKYDLTSAELLKIVPLDFLKRAFYGLQDLEIELAAARVHDHLKEQK